MFNFIFDGKIGQILAPVTGFSNQLFLAIQHHRNEETRQLIESCNFDLSAYSDGGYSAIHVACKFNNRFALDYLINKGVSVSLEDKFGNTPLHFAAKYGHLDLCKLLVQLGCRCSKKNMRQQTAYDVAVSLTVRQYLLPLQFQEENDGDKNSIGNYDQRNYEYMNATVPAPTYDNMYGYSGEMNLPPSSVTITTPNSINLQSNNLNIGMNLSAPLSSTNSVSPPSTNQTPVTSMNNQYVQGSRGYPPGTSNKGIMPDGFHSSASDPALQAKYGHIKEIKEVAPPPTFSAYGSGAGPQQVSYSMFGAQAEGFSAPPPSIYNRYVAYDAVSNSTVPPPPLPGPSYVPPPINIPPASAVPPFQPPPSVAAINPIVTSPNTSFRLSGNQPVSISSTEPLVNPHMSRDSTDGFEVIYSVDAKSSSVL